MYYYNSDRDRYFNRDSELFENYYAIYDRTGKMLGVITAGYHEEAIHFAKILSRYGFLRGRERDDIRVRRCKLPRGLCSFYVLTKRSIIQIEMWYKTWCPREKRICARKVRRTAA